MKKFYVIATLLFSAALIFYVTSLHQPGPFEVSDDFEDGSSPVWMWEIAHPGQFAIVPDPSGRPDNHVAYFKIRTDDPIVKKSKRVEVKLGTVPMGSAYRYAFSAYLPDDYAVEASSENLAQWHEMPDFALGEFWRSPPIKLMTQNGRWVLSRKLSDRKVNRYIFLKKAHHNHLVDDLGPAVNGQWVRWEFLIRWSWQEDGRLRILRDGEEILRYRGPTNYRDWKGPYFKIGMYKPDWTVHPGRSRLTVRDIYYDDIEVEVIDPSSLN